MFFTRSACLAFAPGTPWFKPVPRTFHEALEPGSSRSTLALKCLEGLMKKRFLESSRRLVVDFRVLDGRFRPKGRARKKPVLHEFLQRYQERFDRETRAAAVRRIPFSDRSNRQNLPDPAPCSGKPIQKIDRGPAEIAYSMWAWQRGDVQQDACGSVAQKWMTCPHDIETFFQTLPLIAARSAPSTSDSV